MLYHYISIEEYGETEMKERSTRRRAVFYEIEARSSLPSKVFELFELERESGVILEYGLQKNEGKRYSFLFFDPFAQFEANQFVLTQKIDGNEIHLEGDLLEKLREFLAEVSCMTPENKACFVSGAVGFFTYDAIGFFENIPNRHATDKDLPDLLLKVYRSAIGFDHLEKKWVMSQIIDVNSDAEEVCLEANLKMRQWADRIKTVQYHAEAFSSAQRAQLNLSKIETDISDSDFMAKVDCAKEYIKKGDAFQIVLSRCFKRPYQSCPFDIYKTLRCVSPSPYLFYMVLKDRVILGACPETLVAVEDRKVTINPIAGTRRRVAEKTLHEMEQDLLTDGKELAEHRMLVDLARNDLGAVCKPGSVHVREYAQVKHFSHVSHIASVVEGELQERCDALDALSHAFPAGTLSGAPKIRAMEIIDELETTRRGLYGGGIVRFDFQGNMDSCIAIRMGVFKDGIATIRTGAGIVYDSHPASEAQETHQKANALLEAIAIAEGECS